MMIKMELKIGDKVFLTERYIDYVKQFAKEGENTDHLFGEYEITKFEGGRYWIKDDRGTHVPIFKEHLQLTR